MKSLIWGAIGLIIMAVAAINLKNMLRLKKRGVTVLAEVVGVSEITRGKNKQIDGYTHTMRFEFGGKTVEAEDRTGYNTAFEVGSKQLIICDPEDPEKFEYDDALCGHACSNDRVFGLLDRIRCKVYVTRDPVTPEISLLVEMYKSDRRITDNNWLDKYRKQCYNIFTVPREWKQKFPRSGNFVKEI